MNHRLKKSDCILVLGSHDARVAERGAQLYLEGWAPLLVFSGGFGRLTAGIFDEPEADTFAKIAIRMGVPREKILIENTSTNTGENIRFVRELLVRNTITPKKFILVQKPYMERRAYATFRKVWPEKECLVTSPQITFEEYPDAWRTKEDVIHIIVGDLQRIRLYPAKGFQIYQKIPKRVWKAYERLVEQGYTAHLLKK